MQPNQKALFLPIGLEFLFSPTYLLAPIKSIDNFLILPFLLPLNSPMIRGLVSTIWRLALAPYLFICVLDLSLASDKVDRVIASGRF